MGERESILDRVSEFPEFRSLNLDDKHAYRRWYLKSGIETSELTFGGLYLWDVAHPVSIARIDCFLIVLRDGMDSFDFVVPIGHGDFGKAMRAVSEKLGIESFSRLPESVALNLSPSFVVKEDRDNSDYLYLVENLAKLEGRDFDGKRNWIKRCNKEYSPTYELIGPGTLEECFTLAAGWCNVRQCDANPGLAAEFKTIRRAFEQFRNLDLIGGAVRIDGHIEAFTIAERLNDDTAVVHFEKANPEFKGLYQVINQWFCQNSLGNFKWVNREQDLGISGLRKAKMGYHPDRFAKKYEATFNGAQ